MKGQLSQRESQVLGLAAKGFTDEMIATELGIETGTVNSYWVRIRGKLGHLSRTHLVANYIQLRADQASLVEGTNSRDAMTKALASGERLAKELAESRRQLEDQSAMIGKLRKDHSDSMARANAEINRLKKRVNDSGRSSS